jgi:hypothetical protein
MTRTTPVRARVVAAVVGAVGTVGAVGAVGVVGVVMTTAGVAAAEPVRPLGALGLAGDLTLSGPSPRNRFGADVTVYVGQRLGLYAAARRLTFDPLADSGQLTGGIAYRAAAARPKLELVVHGDGGVAWPLAPVLGGGMTTYLWPTRFPVAITAGLGAYLLVDGVENTRVVITTGLGLALAR